jgi:aryl-alcohol dehydrogenase-like predicted oxidoreductase
MKMRAHEVLDAAWAAGVRYFDAARSYGSAEAFLGTWLNRHADRTRRIRTTGCL